VAGGCRVEGEVSESVLFNDVTVEAGARVEHAVLMSGAHVEGNAVVRNALLDKGVRVRRGTVIGVGSGILSGEYGRKVVYTPAGVAVVPKGEVVGPERKAAALRSERVTFEQDVDGTFSSEPPEEKKTTALDLSGSSAS
jgi:ADP-glucose pyrophosphorylase